MPPLFALVDCNNFYVSCEQVFQPKLTGKPVIVLSNNDGCVVARSNEAKALGIGMGVPEFQIRPLLKAHQVQVFSSNYALYGDLSQRVMETLEQFCPDIERYSIDEAFLSLSGFTSRHLTNYGRTIRRTVQRWTGIPVSIGIAETKTLAKLANRIAKRNPDTSGVFDLTACSDRDRLLGRIPVEEVWGIGPNHARTLINKGITTALHLCQADHQWIRRHLGIVGLRLVKELGGRSCLALEDCPPPKQSITCSRSFGTPITTLTAMEAAVSVYVSRAAEKLRREGLAATHLTIFLTTNPFKAGPQYSNALTRTLPVATDSTPELIRVVLHSLQRIYREGYAYKKAGVLLTGLVPVSQIQFDLFTTSDRSRMVHLMKALDVVNDRWGSSTLQYASSGLTKNWTAKFMRRSLAYTTRWSDLPTVSAS